KLILKQLIPALAPLLTSKALYAIYFTRAILDFVTIVQYRTYNEEILQYIEYALYWIDKLKGDVFLLFRLSKAGLLYFNIPKLYAITYYLESI
ncbi:uncharacterized protein K441DRAFT_545185, partial [Cenococcum geophilum 1.58]|uniref:uncharacterized protein n=1 Tax=Cenococcum geophilum 1.58 TaxID=794803 RepID=UPI00358F8549